MREMKIIGLALDQKNESSVVVLKEVTGDTALPIVVGLLESTGIATGLEKIAFPRPMTHDLLKSLMDELKVSVQRVEISDLRNETFYARIYLNINNAEEVRLDARPSDALAIALRNHSRIYVHERVIQKSSQIHTAEHTETGSDQENEVRTILKSFSPEDFGQY
jgi:bifunctional DNase/RNase